MPLAALLALLWALNPAAMCQAADLKAGIANWLVYYASQADPKVVARFDLVALDADHHPPLLRLGPNKPLYLGYISLGEAEPHRDYYKQVQGSSMLVGRNQNWNADYVDIRSPEWQSLLLERLIPRILRQGFDGLFLDTLDSALYLEQYKDPQRFKGVKDALVGLIAKIREKFPRALLCANRGREIWEQAAPYLDFVVLEDFSTSYDFDSKSYQTLNQDEIGENLQWAQLAQKANPKVMPLVIDYVAPDDVPAANRAIDLARQHGLVTYVSDLDLDEVYLYTLNR